MTVTARVLVAGRTTFYIVEIARPLETTHFVPSSTRTILVSSVILNLNWMLTRFVKDLSKTEITLALCLKTVCSAMTLNAPSVKKDLGKSLSQEIVFYPLKTVLKVVLSALPMNALLVRLDTQHNHGRFV